MRPILLFLSLQESGNGYPVPGRVSCLFVDGKYPSLSKGQDLDAILPMHEHSEQPIPLIRPTLPDMAQVLEMFRQSCESGAVTSGQIVATFEEEARRFTGADHAVAVSSCTLGLMLAFVAMDFPDGAEVVVPSFTFAATVEAVVWNRLVPVYVDCVPGTMTIDPDEVVKAIGPRTAAVCPVNIFGLPPDMDRLQELSANYGIPLLFDSAQALGSTFGGKPAGGFGLCEVFSLSPTKVVTAIEGGLVTTNDRSLAEKLRSMRDYGKGPDGEDMVYNGLSARMSELHGAVGLMGLRDVDRLVSARLRLIGRYRARLAKLPGCRVQEFPNDRTSNGNYFTLLIRNEAKLGRDAVYEKLKSSHIQAKRYFHPPVHAQTAFRDRPHRVVGDLLNTWSASRESLALPLYSHLTDQQQDRVCKELEALLKM
jgi:dTDP-4-amino-4,6-dideoxygalactose transaminase